MDGANRIDPLNHLRRYTEGYNITNKHYWSSTIFTGISGYVIGIVWLVGGIVFVGIVAAKFRHTNKKRKKSLSTASYSGCFFFSPIILGFFITISIISVGGVVLGGNSSFHVNAKLVRNTVLGAAQKATVTIYNVTGPMKSMEENMHSSNARASRRLKSMYLRLEAEAQSIQNATTKNQRLINRGLKLLYTATITIISLIMVLALLSLVSGLLHRPRLFCLTILICWLLTSFCWICFGVYYSLGKFAGDTCSSIEMYKEDQRNSSLTAILPCEKLSTNGILYNTRAAIHDLVNKINANISTQASSLKGVEFICNPFSAAPAYLYQPENCPPDTIKIGDISSVLKSSLCSGVDSNCSKTAKETFGISLTVIEAYTGSVQDLINAFPGMESLVNCSFVNETFSKILSDGCPPVLRSIRIVWSSLAALSTLMVVLVIIWVTKYYQDEKHGLMASYVIPHAQKEEVPQPEDGMRGAESWQVL